MKSLLEKLWKLKQGLGKHVGKPRAWGLNVGCEHAYLY